MQRDHDVVPQNQESPRSPGSVFENKNARVGIGVGLLGISLLFQNCAPSNFSGLATQQNTTQQSSAVSCSAYPFLGTWKSDLSSPTGPEIEFNADCTGKTQNCPSTFRYQPLSDGSVVFETSQTEYTGDMSDIKRCFKPGSSNCSVTRLGRDTVMLAVYCREPTSVNSFGYSFEAYYSKKN